MEYDEIIRDARRARELGDTELELALLRKADQLKSAPKEQPPNPATEYGGLPLRPFGIDTGVTMPEGVSRVMAGVGGGLTNLVRGAGQTFVAVDTDTIREAEKRDAPLNNTAGGMSGNLLGTVAGLLPSAFIPGANTLAGSAAIGAATGLLAPVTDENVLAGKLRSTVTGGVLGPATILGGRAAHSGIGAVKGLIDPFTDAGQGRVVGRTLSRFATNADDAARAASSASSPVPGYRPTLAEVTQDPGIAGLQRAVASLPESGAQIGAVQRSNAIALKDAIGRVAGDDAAMSAAKSAREQATESLYAFADDAVLPVNKELRDLLKRPVIRSALSEAKTNASNRGQKLMMDLTPKTKGVDGKTLHQIKKAIDDAYESAKLAGGAGSDKAKAIAQAKQDYLAWVESRIPAYGEAREAFAELSRPINQMQIGGLLGDKLSPALDDFAETGGLRGAMFAQALRNPDQVVRQATGNSGKLSQIMDPEQLAAIEGVGKAIAGKVSAENMGRAVGSNTAQNLASQNLMRQIAGPLGMPESFMDAQVWPTIMRPFNAALRGQEPAIHQKMAEAVINPQLAAQLMRAGVPKEKIGPLIQQMARYGAMPGLLSVNVTQQ